MVFSISSLQQKRTRQICASPQFANRFLRRSIFLGSGVVNLHDARQKLMQDESMSREERLSNVRARREKADKKIPDILDDDQKKKLDQFERQPHPELHGNLHGVTPPPTRTCFRDVACST
jgi:hypothetical protein